MKKNFFRQLFSAFETYPDPTICFNHNNPQKRFYLWFAAGWLRAKSAPHGIHDK